MKSIGPYLQIARPDHWFKNVFMLPGLVFAFYDAPHTSLVALFPHLLLGVAAACLAASSNYTLNEVIDGPMDARHPVKKTRPVPSGKVNIPLAYAQWLALGILACVLGWQVNIWFFSATVFLLVMGVLYNVPPIRLKDLPYFDVLSESINNPIRLFLGWHIINDQYAPTLSAILAYWMIGAFFMTVKRYAEYTHILKKEGKQCAVEYRKSFRYYDEGRLILSMVYYASAFGLMAGIFLIRYKIELILSIPFIAGFIAVYMRLAFVEDSPAQYPEKLYTDVRLMAYSAFCFILILGLFFVDIPALDYFFRPYTVR